MRILRRLTTELLGLDNEDEDDDEYDSGVALYILVLVLVLLLVLDIGIFEMGSNIRMAKSFDQTRYFQSVPGQYRPENSGAEFPILPASYIALFHLDPSR